MVLRFLRQKFGNLGIVLALVAIALLTYAVFVLFALLLAFTFPRILSLLFDEADTYPSLASMARAAGGAWLSGTLVAAILLFFSTFLPGFGDVLAFVLIQFSLGMAATLGSHFPSIAKAATIARENTLPDPFWDQILRGQAVFGAATGRFVLALTVFLIGAAFVFSRRQFSYGQD